MRAKNSIKVAFKNLIDFYLASALYGLSRRGDVAKLAGQRGWGLHQAGAEEFALNV